MPETIDKVFFRADSGFFSGRLFDLLESYGWDYLVKMKLKNLKKLLQSKTWEPIKGNEDVATYKAQGWSKPRILRLKKGKFKKQEHRTFIDWFIAVPAKITRSGYQMAIKLYSLSR